MNLELIKIRNGSQYVGISIYTEIIVLDIRIREVHSLVEYLKVSLGAAHKVTQTHQSYLKALQVQRQNRVEEYEKMEAANLAEIRAHETANKVMDDYYDGLVDKAMGTYEENNNSL